MLPEETAAEKVSETTESVKETTEEVSGKTEETEATEETTEEPAEEVVNYQERYEAAQKEIDSFKNVMEQAKNGDPTARAAILAFLGEETKQTAAPEPEGDPIQEALETAGYSELTGISDAIQRVIQRELKRAVQPIQATQSEAALRAEYNALCAKFPDAPNYGREIVNIMAKTNLPMEHAYKIAAFDKSRGSTRDTKEVLERKKAASGILRSRKTAGAEKTPKTFKSFQDCFNWTKENM